MQNCTKISIYNTDEDIIIYSPFGEYSSSLYINKKRSKSDKKLRLRKVKKVKLKNVC
jgi:hypothetical protein